MNRPYLDPPSYPDVYPSKKFLEIAAAYDHRYALVRQSILQFLDEVAWTGRTSGEHLIELGAPTELIRRILEIRHNGTSSILQDDHVLVPMQLDSFDKTFLFEDIRNDEMFVFRRENKVFHVATTGAKFESYLDLPRKACNMIKDYYGNVDGCFFNFHFVPRSIFLTKVDQVVKCEGPLYGPDESRRKILKEILAKGCTRFVVEKLKSIQNLSTEHPSGVSDLLEPYGFFPPIPHLTNFRNELTASRSGAIDLNQGIGKDTEVALSSIEQCSRRIEKDLRTLLQKRKWSKVYLVGNSMFLEDILQEETGFPIEKILLYNSSPHVMNLNTKELKDDIGASSLLQYSVKTPINAVNALKKLLDIRDNDRKDILFIFGLFLGLPPHYYLCDFGSHCILHFLKENGFPHVLVGQQIKEITDSEHSDIVQAIIDNSDYGRVDPAFNYAFDWIRRDRYFQHEDESIIC